MKELLDDVAVELLADELHVVVRDAVGLDVAAALHVAKLAQLRGGVVRGLRADMGEEVTVQAGERDVSLPFIHRTVLVGIIHQFYQPALRTAPGILSRTLTHQPVIIIHQLLMGLRFQIAIFFVRHKYKRFDNFKASALTGRKGVIAYNPGCCHGLGVSALSIIFALGKIKR